MRKIPLSGGKDGLFALVDAEDFERLNAFKWSASFESYNQTKVYAIRWSRKAEHGTGKRYKIRMARVVMGLPPGLFAEDNLIVDHGPGIGIALFKTLDNRKANLKTITQWENMGKSSFGSPSSINRKVEEPCL